MVFDKALLCLAPKFSIVAEVSHVSYYPYVRFTERQVTAVDAAAFQQMFQRYPEPVLLQCGDTWHFNPPAQKLALTEAELAALPNAEQGNASVWIRDQLYHVVICPVEGGAYYVLRADAFLSTAGVNLSTQIRQRVSQGLLACRRLSGSLNRGAEGVQAQNGYLGDLRRQLTQILRMAEQLELSARPEERLCRLAAVDLVAFLRDRFCPEVEGYLEAVGVSLTLDLALSADLLQVPADEAMLRYLLLNLVSNAVKALPAEGGKVSLSLRAEGDRALITVSDNGSGLSPDLLSAPRWNHPDLLDPDRGLGLGLPLVQRIISAHRGTIMTTAGPDGSQVVLSLPTFGADLVLSSPSAGPVVEDAAMETLVTLSDILPASFYIPTDDEYL